MKLVMTTVIYALLFALSAGAAFAQEKPQPAKAPEAPAKATAADPTVDQILDKYVQAIGGRQAVEKIESDHNFDVVLMDVHMPIMDGVEATRIVRSKEEPFYKRLPIIALTASMLISEINEIHECGMNDYILKPFDPKGLYEKLAKYQKVS